MISNKKKGLTLIELCFTLLLCSILTLVTINSFYWLKNKNEKERLINEIKGAIFTAKMRSFNEGHSLILSAKEPDYNWSKGIVLRSQDQVLFQWNWLFNQWNVEWHGLNGKTYITIIGTTHGISNGQFILSNKTTKEKITLTLNKLGRIRVASL